MAILANLSDAELIDLLKTDNEDAFTEIYNRYWKLLLNTANNILRDPAISQDIVQNVFSSLWLRRHEVVIHAIKPYLQQSIRFSVAKVIRAQQTDAKFYDRLQTVTSEIIADDPLIFKEQQELLKELLTSMPENCGEVFHLSREEGLSNRQIASQLNISQKTVEKRMTRSLKYLRKGLNWELCIAIATFCIKFR